MCGQGTNPEAASDEDAPEKTCRLSCDHVYPFITISIVPSNLTMLKHNSRTNVGEQLAT